MWHGTHLWYVLSITHTTVYMHSCPSTVTEHNTNLFSPGEHDGNEPEILASILDELILELNGTQKKKKELKCFKKLNRFQSEYFFIWSSCEPVYVCRRCWRSSRRSPGQQGRLSPSHSTWDWWWWWSGTLSGGGYNVTVTACRWFCLPVSCFHPCATIKLLKMVQMNILKAF